MFLFNFGGCFRNICFNIHSFYVRWHAHLWRWDCMPDCVEKIFSWVPPGQKSNRLAHMNIRSVPGLALETTCQEPLCQKRSQSRNGKCRRVEKLISFERNNDFNTSFSSWNSDNEKFGEMASDIQSTLSGVRSKYRHKNVFLFSKIEPKMVRRNITTVLYFIFRLPIQCLKDAGHLLVVTVS